MPANSKEFGDRLKTTIKDAGMTQAAFASKMDISPEGLGHFVRGRVPDALLAKKFADALNVPLVWLLIGEDETPSAKGVAETDAPYDENYTEEEVEYRDKLVTVLRNPKTKMAIMNNLDTFLQVPNVNPCDKIGQRHRKRGSKKIANSNGDK